MSTEKPILVAIVVKGFEDGPLVDGCMTACATIKGVSSDVIAYFELTKCQLSEDEYREAVRLESSNRGRAKESPEHVRTTVHHGDQYINYGTVGAIGQSAVGTVNTFQQCWQRIEPEIDLVRLAAELNRLRAELVKEAASPHDFIQLGIVAQAESDARSSDGPGVMKTLSKVAWTVFEAAERIGTDLLAKVIVEAAKG